MPKKKKEAEQININHLTTDIPNEEKEKLLKLKKEAEELEQELIRKAETAKLVKVVLEEENRSKKEIYPKKFKPDERDLRLDILNTERYSASHTDGLTSEQVKSQIEKKLTNKSNISSGKTVKSIIFENVFTFFNILCIAVAAALMFVGAFSDLFFLIIMLANIAIGVSQEIKAKNTIANLSLISAPTATVIRDKERINVHVDDVVLDDILYLENGRQICADSIIIKGEIEVNESLLTGESVPVLKKVGDTLYGGSFVSSGNCYARVDKIGSLNYMESLTAFAKRYRKARSELLGTMRFIIKVAGFIIVPTAIVLFYTSYQSNKDIATLANMEVLKNSITSTSASIIGMIPAGMFLLTSVTLAVSVIKLGKKNILVQDLYCIEMLARVDVLCLDKTGTITDGTMTVKNVITYENKTEYSLADIMGSFLVATEDNNQTATALASYFGFSRALSPKVIMPFSSQRKYSAVSFEKVGCFILGAPEFVLKDMGARLERTVNELAMEGFRVLMLAYSPTGNDLTKLPADRKAFAIFVLEDHIREDAIPTLNWFRDNDVAIKIISGDNPLTVSEVAKRVGIPNASQYISLDGLADSEVIEVASLYTVFGRVTPEQKRLLIRAMKAKGSKVAMTGDGVNDILALKEADCSVAMANGSEAARNVSHLVLLDSNFANMPSVVHEGRRVVNNIQKSSSLFLMKTLFSMIFSWIIIIMTALYNNVTYPLTPKHLLPLEIFIIGIPSFCLAFQSNSKRIEGDFFMNVIKKSFPAGIALVMSCLSIFIYSRSAHFPVVTNPNSQFLTMVLFALTYTGWIALLKMCMPLDSYRLVLCLASFTACFIMIFALSSSFFKIEMLAFSNLLFTLVVVQASYFMLSIVTAAINKIKIN